MRKLLTCLLIFLAAPLLGADLTQQPAAVVRAPSAGTWTVIDQGLAIVPPVTLDGGKFNRDKRAYR